MNRGLNRIREGWGSPVVATTVLKIVCDQNDMASKTPIVEVDRTSTLSAKPPKSSLIEDATHVISDAQSVSDVVGFYPRPFARDLGSYCRSVLTGTAEATLFFLASASSARTNRLSVRNVSSPK